MKRHDILVIFFANIIHERKLHESLIIAYQVIEQLKDKHVALINLPTLKLKQKYAALPLLLPAVINYSYSG